MVLSRVIPLLDLMQNTPLLTKKKVAKPPYWLARMEMAPALKVNSIGSRTPKRQRHVMPDEHLDHFCHLPDMSTKVCYVTALLAFCRKRLYALKIPFPSLLNAHTTACAFPESCDPPVHSLWSPLPPKCTIRAQLDLALDASFAPAMFMSVPG